jgi:hypothetical protein
MLVWKHFNSLATIFWNFLEFYWSPNRWSLKVEGQIRPGASGRLISGDYGPHTNHTRQAARSGSETRLSRSGFFLAWRTIAAGCVKWPPPPGYLNSPDASSFRIPREHTPIMIGTAADKPIHGKHYIQLSTSHTHCGSLPQGGCYTKIVTDKPQCSICPRSTRSLPAPSCSRLWPC